MRKTRLYTAAQNLLNPQELLVEVVDLHPRHLPRQTVDGVDSDQEISAGCIGKGRHRRHQWYYVAIRRTRHLELVLDRLPLAHLVGDQRSKSCHIDVFDRYRYHGYFPVRTNDAPAIGCPVDLRPRPRAQPRAATGSRSGSTARWIRTGRSGPLRHPSMCERRSSPRRRRQTFMYDGLGSTWAKGTMLRRPLPVADRGGLTSEQRPFAR